MRRTAKGEMVDFDLIRAKSQIADKPAPEEVSVRQSIIDRRLRKKASAMTPSPINTTPNVADEVVEEVVEEVETADVAEDVTDAENIESVKEDDALDVPVAKKEPKRRRRQKTKQKPQSSGDDENDNITNQTTAQ